MNSEQRSIYVYDNEQDGNVDLHPTKQTLNGYPQCLRWTMFGMNLTLLLASLLTVGYGTYLMTSKWHILSTENEIPILFFIVFAVLLLISCLGSVSTYRLSSPLLRLYSCIMILCVILQIALILVVVMADINSSDFLENRWKGLSVDDKHFIEGELDCCGFNQVTPDDTCTDYQVYCEPKLTDYITHTRLLAILLGSAILAFQIICVLLSCLILRSLREQLENMLTESYDVEYSYMSDHEHPSRYSL